ncbi:hypothetical protein EAF00_009303 [Botryotinia globosa]|nr:hypothetical protein EAF00_009303 [Botryotinia globosa]
MDGFSAPSWPSDNQNSTTPGMEIADDEFGRSTAVDGLQQQNLTSYYLPNELPKGSTAEEYNQLQPGDTTPSKFQFNQTHQLTTPCVNQIPRFSNSLGFANGNTDGYAFPTFASPGSPHANPPLNTGSPRIAFNNQGGSPSYLDPKVARSQSATLSPPLQIPSTINGQSCTTENAAPLNPPFDQYDLLTVSKPDYVPHDSGVFDFGSGQADVQDDLGSNGNIGVYFGDDSKFATYPMLNGCEPCAPDRRFSQFGNTDGFEDNHHSNQIATEQEWEHIEGLPECQNEFFALEYNTKAFLTQVSDHYSPGRHLPDKCGTFKYFSELPPELQIMVWEYSFPVGRGVSVDCTMYPAIIGAIDRDVALPIALAVCKLSRQIAMEHYTIVDRHREGIRAVYTKPFCFNPEVDTLCITYDFIEAFDSEMVRNDWYDKVDKALKKKGALKGVGLRGVRFLDVRDVVTSWPVVTSNISWFLPHLYKDSFLSRFEKLDRLVFTSACPIDDRFLLPRTVALEGLGECELFWEELAKYLEEKRNSHEGKLVAKEDIIVREYQHPQGISALENLEKMCWLF